MTYGFAVASAYISGHRDLDYRIPSLRNSEVEGREEREALMPWWGYLLSGMAVWLVGFIAGRASGIAAAMRQLMISQAAKKGPDLTSLMAAGGLGHVAERESQGN